MEVECHRVKIKDNSLENIHDWAETLNNRMEEVLESIKREGVIVESVFLEEASDGNYLIYYMRSKDLKKARKVAQEKPLPIDDYHTKMVKENTSGAVRLKCLLDAHCDD